jgi:hypothetical protein
MADDMLTEDEKALFTFALVEQCVRNTGLEDLHAGVAPSSATGDYSDVKVVTPYGEIPWTRFRGQRLTAGSGVDSRLPFGGGVGRAYWADGGRVGDHRHITAI